MTPSLWKNKIQDQLNYQLSQRGDWELKLNKLQGHLLFNVTIDSVYLINSNSSNISISKVDLKLNLIKSLFGHPSLKYLRLTDLSTNLYRSDKTIYTKSDPFELKSILEKDGLIKKYDDSAKILVLLLFTFTGFWGFEW